MAKKRFKGNFNLSGQCLEMYTHSLTVQRAFLNFINQMHNKHGVPKRLLFSIFDGSKDNYLIQER